MSDNTKAKPQHKDAPKYRPKTANPQTKVEPVEESKVEVKPRNDKPRGGRGRGGNEQREHREKRTERGGHEHRGGHVHKGEHRGGHKQDGEHKPKQQDKNSWQYKYYNQERPKYERVTVTAETEVPVLPTKDELLKFPSKDVFDEDMAKLDKKIKELRQQKDELCEKRREVIDGGKVQGSTMTYREIFN